jgi:hypothetical protein
MLFYVSLALEVVIVFFGLHMCFVRRRPLGAAIAFSFVLYILFNLIKTFQWNVPNNVQDGIFFVATLSIFLVVVALDRRQS